MPSIGKPTANHMGLTLAITTDAGIETPALLTRVGIQSGGHAVRRADKQSVTNLQWGRFGWSSRRSRRSQADHQCETPSLFLLAGVFRCDQIRCRVTIPVLQTTVGRPFALRTPGLALRSESPHLRFAECTLDGVVILRQRVAGHQRTAARQRPESRWRRQARLAEHPHGN